MGKTPIMTEQEKKEWDDLYQYVRKEILQYDVSQSIPPSLCLRLKGLTKGKFIENKKIPDKANYSYKIVLYTFQICKPTILSSISNKHFSSETNKFNYICKIVENHINDVYLRVQKAEQSNKDLSQADTKALQNQGMNYKKSSAKKINKRLEELW